MSTYEQKQIIYTEAFTLTSSFLNAKTTGNLFIDCANFDEMTIYPEFDPASSGDILSLAVEFAPQVDPGTTTLTEFHPETDETVAAGIGTLIPKTRDFTSTVAGNQFVPVISIPINDRFLRILAKDDAGTTGVVKLRIILSKISS